jgi:hypothetical protein
LLLINKLYFCFSVLLNLKSHYGPGSSTFVYQWFSFWSSLILSKNHRL